VNLNTFLFEKTADLDRGRPVEEEDHSPPPNTEGTSRTPMATNTAPPVFITPQTGRVKRNWQIYSLYARGEHDDCLKVIETQLNDCRGQAEYPLYVKGLILRERGQVQDSLQLFQAATVINPTNMANLKQVARSLYLLGKHSVAISVYDETEKATGKSNDWEIWHNKGLCYMYLKRYTDAIKSFERANQLQRHDTTFMQLARVHTLIKQFEKAIEVYLEALEFSPENPELLTAVGLLFLRLGKNFKAFEYLGNSLTHDPVNPKTILAAGSIIQDHGDFEVALTKYRISALKTPNSAELWNNVGICFFDKEKYVAAIACLKRAVFLDPFAWLISYNLGLVHLNTGQYASSYHYLSASINLNPKFAPAFMCLGIALARMKDPGNAMQSYEKAIALDADDYMTHLNFAVTLANCGERDRSRKHLDLYKKLLGKLDEDALGNVDDDVTRMAKHLERQLNRG
jgi:Bardet-Biedl syndrome 4 protein